MNLTPTLDIFVAVLKKSGDSYKSHQQPNLVDILSPQQIWRESYQFLVTKLKSI